MTNQSFYLFQLQKIDSRSDKIDKRRKEIKAILSNHDSLASAEAEANKAQNRLTITSNELVKVETSNRDKRVKIEQSESSLYSGSVKNPKELSDLQLEIASLKKSLVNIENDQLNLMVQLETQQNDVVEYQNRLTLEQAKFAEQNSQALGELSALEAELSRFSAERTAILHQILPEYLSLYEKIRSSKKGIAVTSVDEQSCAICGAELTPSECQQARSSTQMAFCPSCGRILYAG